MKTMKFGLVLCALVISAQVFGGEPRVEEVGFASHGATLSGSVVFPEGQPTHAALVFVHGSGKQTRNLELAKRLAREGIATLVYDKRGAGKSGGDYEGEQNVSEKNIALLADDAVAALEKLSARSVVEGRPRGLRGHQPGGLDRAAGRGENQTREIPRDVERAGFQA